MSASVTLPRKENSTTVRAPKPDPFALRVVRGGMGLLSRVAPDGAAAVAEQLFLTPRRRPRPATETRALLRARPFPLPTKRGPLAGWEWGNEGPRVLLVHGWEGRGAQLAGLAERLAMAGFRVVTFDAPGHGDSPGKRSSLFHFADGIEAAAEAWGPLHAVVTHSMGGAAALWANRRAPLAPRLVMIAPPVDLRDFTRALSGVLGITEDVRGRVHERLTKRFGVQIAEVRAERLAATMHGPLLVVHDEADREGPIACGDAIAKAWPGAELVRTRGLGHHRILRDGATLDLIVRYVAQRSAYRPMATDGAGRRRVPG
jgi:pimeloyl-ACP methyl ester carboxylesterase